MTKRNASKLLLKCQNNRHMIAMQLEHKSDAEAQYYHIFGWAENRATAFDCLIFKQEAQLKQGLADRTTP